MFLKRVAPQNGNFAIASVDEKIVHGNDLVMYES